MPLQHAIIPILCTLLLFLTHTTLAIPHPSRNTTLALSLPPHNTTHHPHLLPRATGGSCPHTHYPSESTYRDAINLFCDNFCADANGPHPAQGPKPIVGTVNLLAYDKTMIQWIFWLGSDGYQEYDWVWFPDQTNCKIGFASLLEGFPAGFLVEKEGAAWKGGGKLGENYCVVDGSGDQGLSGQGEVLFMGGVADIETGRWTLPSYRTMRFQSRQRNGDAFDTQPRPPGESLDEIQHNPGPLGPA